jgi:site-specific recombinase XerD
VRDAALLGVLYIGGMRRSEVADLKLEDFDAASGAIKVRGKGNKERLIYLSGAASEALLDWVELRGDHAGALFQLVRKSGAMYKDGKVTDSAIYKALRKRALQAGVKSFSPHDLRRTFVGDLLERGADIVTVQQLAGHASVSTTARYDRRGEETKKKAAHSLHLPYRSARPYGQRVRPKASTLRQGFYTFRTSPGMSLLVALVGARAVANPFNSCLQQLRGAI